MPMQQTASTSSRPFPVWLQRVLGIALAVALAQAIALCAQLVFGIRVLAPAGTVAAEPVEIGPLTIAVACLVASFAGWAVLAGLTRVTQRPKRIWLLLGFVVFLASIVLGPLSGSGVSAADRVTLVVMHLAVASTVISVLYRTAGTASQPTQSLDTVAPSAHAAHRPPVHSDSGLSRPPVVFGAIYPRDDVVAVFADLQQAHQADAALHAAGVSDDDSDVLPPEWVLAADRDIDQRRGWIGRFAARISALLSDDGHYIQTYSEEARRGHSLLLVHAATPAVVEQVRQVLSAHGARSMRHFGHLAVTELP